MKKICLIFFVLLGNSSWAEECKQTSAQNKQVLNMGELEKQLTKQLCFEVIPGEKRYSEKSCDKAIRCSNLITQEYPDDSRTLVSADVKPILASAYVEKALRENFEKMAKLKKQIDLAKKIGANIPDSCRNKKMYDLNTEDPDGNLICDKRTFNKGFNAFLGKQEDENINLSKYESVDRNIEFALLDVCLSHSTAENLEKKISECAKNDPFLGAESGLNIKNEIKNFGENEKVKSFFFSNPIKDFRKHIAEKTLTDSYCQSIPSTQNICEIALGISDNGFKSVNGQNVFIDPMSFLLSVKMNDDLEKYSTYEERAKIFDVNNLLSQRSYLLLLDSERCKNMPFDQITSLDTPAETASQISKLNGQGILASPTDTRYVPNPKPKLITVVSPNSLAVVEKKADPKDVNPETKPETKNETTKPQEATQPFSAQVASRNQYQVPITSQPISQQYSNPLIPENTTSNLVSNAQAPTQAPQRAHVQSESKASLPSSPIAANETSSNYSSESKLAEVELSKLKAELDSLKSNLKNNSDKSKVAKSSYESNTDNQSSIASSASNAGNEQNQKNTIYGNDSNGSNGSFNKTPEQPTDFNKEGSRSVAQSQGIDRSSSQASAAYSAGGQASKAGLVLTKVEELTPEKANEAIGRNEPIYIEENGLIKELSLAIKDGKVLIDDNGKPVYTKIVRGKVGDKKFASLVKKGSRAPASVVVPKNLPDAKRQDEKIDPTRLYQLKNILNKVAN